MLYITKLLGNFQWDLKSSLSSELRKNLFNSFYLKQVRLIELDIREQGHFIFHF